MKLFRNQQGTEWPEYGLLIALISVIAIAVVTLVGQNLLQIFESLWQAIFGG